MLLELRIRNFAIIEETSLEFGPGLNVLSGETGAGKTIILSALGLLLGERASPDMVRAGEKEAIVEALFELEGEAPIPELAERVRDAKNRELLIRRVVAESSRSRVSIDGEMATVQSLSKLGAALVQVYGQREQQSLLRSESHREVLDRFANLDAALAAYREVFERAVVMRARLKDLARRERERSDLLELARFRVTELARAELVAGEDEELLRARTVLANAAKLAAAASESESALSGDEGAALDSVRAAETRLVEAAAIDPKLNDALEMIRTARTNLEEASRTLGAYASRVEADPTRLEQIENRLQELTRLKRKYGGSIDSALETLARSHGEIAELEGIAESMAEVQSELNAAVDELLAHAKKLSAARKRAAEELGRKMEAELKTLAMRSVAFEARLGAIAAGEAEFVHHGIAIGPVGLDTVELFMAPNLGQPAMPLARIASGGELSRVMLALKRLEAQRRGVTTMIFDEVDAGIGGAVAQVVGHKLKQLARFHQILCVTHLAQIAAYADRHFTVEKEERRGSTRSRVRLIDNTMERTEEIARMLGGDVSEKLRRAARELLDRAAE
jgi:DNA repair protein RecN (Recombination protein N)